MIILWIIMWFIAGFLMTLAICNLKKRREMEKALMERLMLHKALCIVYYIRFFASIQINT